jgi:prepilin-type processing-associated H-X9-DG protein
VNELVPPGPLPKTSGLAIASLVLGILGLLCLVPIVSPILAVVFGIIAIKQIAKSDGLSRGRSQAVSGLAIGGIALLLQGVMLQQVLYQAREVSRREFCLSNMKALGLVIAMYADENGGRIPRNLEDARKFYTSDEILICPSAKNGNTPSYQILLGGKRWNSPETIDAVVLTEPLSNHHGAGRNALYGDGHVEWVSALAPINNP